MTPELIAPARRSRRLHDPVPDDAELDGLVRAVKLRHARALRIIRLRGDALDGFREALGGAFDARRREQGLHTSVQLRVTARHRYGRAPLLLVAAVRGARRVETPWLEHITDASAAVERLCVALRIAGYTAERRTGADAYDPAVKAALGLTRDDALLGFVDVGTSRRGTSAYDPGRGHRDDD